MLLLYRKVLRISHNFSNEILITTKLLKITVIGITGLGGVTGAFGFYLDVTRQVYIHRLRFPNSNAHKLKIYIFYYKSL